MLYNVILTDKFGRIKNNPVEDIIPGLEQHIITVNQNERTIDVFKRMAENNIIGVGVVNDEGVLVDTLSVRDIRAIG
jgi:CBS domain-containing protein